MDETSLSYKIQVMEDYANGYEVEARSRTTACPYYNKCSEPGWDWRLNHYRTVIGSKEIYSWVYKEINNEWVTDHKMTETENLEFQKRLLSCAVCLGRIQETREVVRRKVKRTGK